MDVLYYGYLRDAIGRDREALEVPSHVLTLDDLAAWLREQGEPYASAFQGRAVAGGAVAGERAEPGDSLFGAHEVALFPPVGVL